MLYYIYTIYDCIIAVGKITRNSRGIAGKNHPSGNGRLEDLIREIGRFGALIYKKKVVFNVIFWEGFPGTKHLKRVFLILYPEK